MQPASGNAASKGDASPAAIGPPLPVQGIIDAASHQWKSGLRETQES